MTALRSLGSLLGFLCVLPGMACSTSGVTAPPGAPTAAPPSSAPTPAPVSSASTPNTPESRAEALLQRMTVDEKIDYLGGDKSFFIRGIPRLGIPEIKMSDGPAGCRNWGPSTAYPGALGLAATFDTGLLEQVGAAIGRDCRARGVHILLAPGVNIHRSPLNGRNFEYMGEDPYLAGKSASAYIRGVQGAGVLATVKHFAGNNQEWDRNHISSEIDETTLREIYFPAFERAVVEGNVSAVMTAYNLLNGTYCSHNPWLLRQVLRDEWGFRGLVMSDWEAVHDTLGATQGGCDLEMPSGKYLNRTTLLPLLKSGQVQQAVLDEKVRRILRTLIAAGFFDRPQKIENVPVDDPATAAVALTAAERSLVLLKNDRGLLPLDRSKLKRIAVIGPNADPAVVGGSGSGFVTPSHKLSLLQGVRAVAAQSEVLYHPGVQQKTEGGYLGRPCFDGPAQQEIFQGEALSGNPVEVRSVDRIDFRPADGFIPAPGLASEHYSMRWKGTVLVPKAGRYRVITNTDDGVRVDIDQNRVINDWNGHAPTTNTASVELTAGRHAVTVEYFQGTLGAVAQFGFGPELKGPTFEGAQEISALARKADAVVVAVGFGQSEDTNSAGSSFGAFWPPAWARQGGFVESEDSDRPFTIPAAQLETIRLAAAANPKTIVVINSGGAVDAQTFLSKVPTLLWAGYPGQEGGRAVANVLFGETSPSGRLPFTWAKRYQDYPSSPSYNLNQGGKTPYSEGLLVGYRGFDQKQMEPAFPFGHGLGYASYEYSGLSASSRPDGSAEIHVRLKNTGSRPSQEVVQVYLAPPQNTPAPATGARPPQELKAYSSVRLDPGQAQEITLQLEPRAFAFWNDAKKLWSVPGGSFEIRVGSSSRDIRLRQALTVAAREISAKAAP